MRTGNLTAKKARKVGEKRWVVVQDDDGEDYQMEYWSPTGGLRRKGVRWY